MNITLLNKNYIALCKAHHIKLSITTTEQETDPKQEIIETETGYTIRLNLNKIDMEDYELYLSYDVSRILLPRLSFDTERLHIRRLKPQDAVDCFAFLSDPHGCMMDCSRPVHSMDEDFQERMEQLVQHEGQYAIVLKESNKVIGAMRIWNEQSRAVEAKEIGYVISPAYRRNGYAYEALTALLHILQKELHIELLLAGVLPENYASSSLLTKLGFCQEGFRRKAIWHEGLNQPVDLIYYYKDAQ